MEFLLERTLDRWNPADYGGIQSLALPGDTLWEPKIRLVNDVDFAASMNNRMTTMLKVMLNGLVMHFYLDRLNCSFSIGLRFFSFDQQICNPQLQTATVYDIGYGYHKYEGFGT